MAAAIGRTTAPGTFLAPYVPSPEPIVDRMLELARVEPGDTVYDLGAGDGRIVVTAAQRFGARAVGVELDDQRFAFASARVRDLGLGPRARIVHGDLAAVDLTPATVVTLYQLPAVNDMLRPALERQLRPGARVVTHDFPIDGWRPSRVVTTRLDDGSRHTVFVYDAGEARKEPTMANNSALDARSYAGARAGLELGGVSVGSLKSFEGGNAYADVVNEKLGVDNVVRKHIGQPKYEDIAISFGGDMSSSLYDWMQATLDGKFPRKDGTIVLSDFNLMERSRLDFYNALITEIGFPACDARSKDPACFTLKISPEYTRTQAVSGKKTSSSYGLAKAQKWLLANYVLAVDGVTDGDVSAVDVLVVKVTTSDSPVGEARDYLKSPNWLEVPNLAIRTRDDPNSDWRDWFDDFVIKGNSGSGERNGTLAYMSPNWQTVLFTLTFSNLGIFRLAQTGVESGTDKIQRMRAEMYCEQLSFTVGATAASKGFGSSPAGGGPAGGSDTSNQTSNPVDQQSGPSFVPNVTEKHRIAAGAPNLAATVAPRLGRPLRFRS